MSSLLKVVIFTCSGSFKMKFLTRILVINRSPYFQLIFEVLVDPRFRNTKTESIEGYLTGKVR